MISVHVFVLKNDVYLSDFNPVQLFYWALLTGTDFYVDAELSIYHITHVHNLLAIKKAL